MTSGAALAPLLPVAARSTGPASFIRRQNEPEGTPIDVRRLLQFAIPLGAACALALAACSGDGKRQTRDSGGSRLTRAGKDALAAAPYQARDVPNGGSLRGTITLEGAPPADSVMLPISDERICGTSVTTRSVELDGARLADVVVWLERIRSGKRLPETRRFELGHDDCQLEPRVQAAIAGGTLNVRNSDPIRHRARFVRQGSGDVVALLNHYDQGEVVPSELVLAQPGAIEVRCDFHPWTHAVIAVFDHPYFAVSARDGSFGLDSIPPGQYRLVAWHPTLGELERTVEVESGRNVEVSFVMRSP